MNKSTNYIITNKGVLILLRVHVLNHQHSFSLSASEFSNAGQSSKFLKLLDRQSFSEHIRAICQLDPSSLNKITNEVVFSVNMLGPSMDLVILSLVVFKNSCFSDALLQQVTCELLPSI